MRHQSPFFRVMCDFVLPVAAASLLLCHADAAIQLADASDRSILGESSIGESDVQLSVHLDVEALLRNPAVLVDSVGDGVWSIAAEPGRRLVQLPMVVEVPDTVIDLSTPPVSLRSSRFLTWHILDDDQIPGRGRATHGGGYGPGGLPPGAGYGPGALPPGAGYGPGALPPGAGYGPSGTGPRDFVPGGGGMGALPMEAMPQAVPMGELPDTTGLPANVPRFARKLSIHPDGTVHWKLVRVIPGGALNESNPSGYALKIRPDLLEKLSPQRRRSPERDGARSRRSSDRRPPGGPGSASRSRRSADRRPPGGGPGSAPRSRRGGSGREDLAQRRAEQAEHRNRHRQFQELRKRIRALPDEFEAPLPTRLWAMFEVPEGISEWKFGGKEPFPWQIKVEDLAMLRQLASGRGGGRREQLDPSVYIQVAQLQQMAKDSHRLTHRAIAHALSASGMTGSAQANDPLYRLLETLLQGEDAEARRVVINELAAVRPPTSVTMALQRNAFGGMSAEEKLISLRGQFSVELSDPVTARQLLATLNAALHDSDGANAGEILAAVVEAQSSEPRDSHRLRGRDAPIDSISFLAGAVNFTRLAEAQRDDAIRYVISAAGSRQLASVWLNKALLGSSDPVVVRRTLELMDLATTPSPIIDPLVQLMMNQVFTPSQVGTAMDPVLELTGLIPIDSANHSVFRVLNSGDPQIQELAWRGLVHFVITEAGLGPRRMRPRQADSGRPDSYKLILDAALAQESIPRSVAIFYANQPNYAAATVAMVRIVAEGNAEGDTAAVKHASRKLHGSGWPIADALSQLEPEMRSRFGLNLYEGLTGSPNAVAALLGDPTHRSPLVRWFGEQLASGELPKAALWAEQFQGDDQLLDLAVGDDRMIADGAVAALVGAAGGDEWAAEDLARRFADHGDRSAAGLKSLWSVTKQQIYAHRLGEASGTYRLVLEIAGEANSIVAGQLGAPGYASPAGEPFGRGPAGPGGGPMPMGPIPPEAMAMMGSQPDPVPVVEFPEPQISMVLGVVELFAEDQEVRLAGDPIELMVPQEYLAIRIMPVGALKNFENEQLTDVDLDNVHQPLDLRPEPNGSWRGTVELGDGRHLRLTMEPL